MTETDTVSPPPPPEAAPASEAAPAPEAVPAPPAPPAAPAPRRSGAWLGGLAAFVAVALLAGATAVLFVRVQEARDRADEAVAIAGSQDAGQDALAARIESLDATLAALASSGSATADDVAAARDQVSSLRKCLNNALDAFAQATQSGKPVSITKC